MSRRVTKPAEGKTPQSPWRKRLKLAALAVLPVVILVSVLWDPPDPVKYVSELTTPGELEDTDGGGAPAPAVFRPETPFELVLRPSAPEHGPITASCFTVRDGHATPWRPAFTVLPDFAIRITGPTATVFKDVPAGLLEVVCAVGRPGKVPTDPGALEDALRGQRRKGEPSWRVVTTEVLLGDR